MTSLRAHLWQSLPSSWRQALSRWWSARHAHEKITLISGGALSLLILVVWVLLSLVSAQQQLAQRLPVLRAQAMKSDFYAQQLAGRESVEPMKAINRVLEFYRNDSITAQPSSGNTRTINVQDLDLPTLLTFIERLEREGGTPLTSAELSSTSPSVWSGTLLLTVP